MFDKLLNRKIANYFKTIAHYTQDLDILYDEDTHTLHISDKFNNTKIDCNGFNSLESAKFELLNKIYYQDLDVFFLEKLREWHQNIPNRLINKDIPVMGSYVDKHQLLCNNLRIFKKCFPEMKVYLHSIPFYEMEFPYFSKPLKDNCSYSGLSHFIVEDLIKLNMTHSNNIISNERLRNGLKELMISSHDINLKQAIKTALELIPETKEDFINIYKYNVSRVQNETLKANINAMQWNLYEIHNDISGTTKMNIRNLARFYLEKVLEEETKRNQEFYNKVKQFVEENSDSKIQEYDFEKNLCCDCINSIIGEYFYIQDSGAIMPDFSKFENLPQKFFDIIEQIENSEREEVYEFDRE